MRERNSAGVAGLRVSKRGGGDMTGDAFYMFEKLGMGDVFGWCVKNMKQYSLNVFIL